jgi:parallel beta-helix repeat protein
LYWEATSLKRRYRNTLFVICIIGLVSGASVNQVFSSDASRSSNAKNSVLSNDNDIRESFHQIIDRSQHSLFMNSSSRYYKLRNNILDRNTRLPFGNLPYRQTITIDGNDWNIIVPDDFPTIQEAINNADIGYRIFVRAGLYKENVVVNIQSLTLRGENKNTTIIDGGGKNHVIKITKDADGINLSGFTIRNEDRFYIGINIKSNYNIIQNNIIVENDAGIEVFQSSGNQIQTNILLGNSFGVSTYDHSHANNISGNTITRNTEQGILIDFICTGNMVYDNLISDNGECGIRICNVSRNNIINWNIISGNDVGIKCSDFSDENLFHHNILRDNIINAYDSSVNHWDTGVKGNFWSDYTGLDSDGDGIGDTPYAVPGDDNEDRFPLMNTTLKVGLLSQLNLIEGKIHVENEPANQQPRGSWSSGNTIIVPDDYPTIQEAVNHANDGDTIKVKEGIYKENILVDKSVNIIGENKERTIVDGDGDSNNFEVTAGNVEITGFTIQNTNNGSAGVKIKSDNCTIKDNIILDCGDGIHLSHTRGNIVEYNIINENNFGIYLDASTDCKITHNTIFDNGDGIGIWMSSNLKIIKNCIENNSFTGILHILSEKNHIEYNRINHNDGIGLQMFYSNLNLIEENTIWNNDFEGISIHKSSYNNFDTNIITNNNYGVSIWFYSYNNSINSNNIASNTFGGILLSFSFDIIIWGNNITGNSLFGIFIGFSSDISIWENRITDNNGYGIWLVFSSETGIFDNTFQFNGILISGSHRDHWTTHNIDNNYANGKPIRYYKNCRNITVPSNTAQIILANCTNFTIKNLHLSNVDVGIQLGLSYDNIISENIITGKNDCGILLEPSSSNNMISGNTINKNLCGIGIGSSSENSISGNNIIDNTMGILLGFSSDNNNINGNTITDNSIGIILITSSDINISGNDITDNEIGIVIEISSNNLVRLNNVTNNFGWGIWFIFSSDNNVWRNNICNNGHGVLWIHFSGIFLTSSSNNSVNDNNIGKNGDEGILLDYSSHNNSIFGNNINSNYVGIQLDDFSSNNSICRNNIDNSDIGIRLDFSSDNNIRSNNIRNNRWCGIRLFSSSGNMVRKNSFIANNYQAFFNNSPFTLWYKNFWDDWPGIIPRPIYGDMLLERFDDEFVHWIQFDWFPALKPYDIE